MISVMSFKFSGIMRKASVLFASLIFIFHLVVVGSILSRRPPVGGYGKGTGKLHVGADFFQSGKGGFSGWAKFGFAFKDCLSQA